MTATPPPLPDGAGPGETPWVGVGLSMMVPGLGVLASGRRLEGWTWFLGMTALGFLALWTFSVRLLPGFLLGVLSCVAGAAVWVMMLRRSYAPVPRLRAGRWLTAAVTAVVFLGAASLLAREMVRPFKVPTGAMSPTIQGTINPADGSDKEADRILVQRCAYWFSKPLRGDVLVFRTEGIDAMPSSQRGQIYIKRIVGLPGDRISFQSGRLMNNGVPVEQPAVFAKLQYEPVPSAGAQYLHRAGEVFEVPPDGYFVVGDNSTNSYDSRFFGPVPAKNVFGRATKIYWPPDRAGRIE